MRHQALIEARESAAWEFIEANCGPETVDQLANHLSRCLYMMITASGEGGSMALTCTLKQSDDILDSLRMDGFDDFTLTVFDEEEDIRTMKVCFQKGIVKSMLGSRILSVLSIGETHNGSKKIVG